MLLSPAGVQTIAQADFQYSQLDTVKWGQDDQVITYTYDANGSLKTKTTAIDGTQTEQVTYQYDLQNRLTYSEEMSSAYTEYSYNDDGIKVGEHDWRMGGQGVIDSYKTFLVDSYNHTGYAQVLEETEVVNWENKTVTCYIIGDDVIGQVKSQQALDPWGYPTGPVTYEKPRYLLYDGHGSTRQLFGHNGSDDVVLDSYSYDGYGVMLGGNPTPSSPKETNLLYTGEQFDTSAQMYYLRARYYDPLNGRFNQTDPFAGSPQDPQSLHKYLYCHANPVNGIDPSGLSFAGAGSLAELNVGMLIGALVIATLASTVLSPTWRHASEQVFVGMIRELRDLAISGESAAIAAYNAVVSNTQIVTKAIDDVAKALRKTVKELSKMKLFPIIKSLTPDIFDFNVEALATHPYWFMLEYNGAGSPVTTANRAWITGTYGWMMATAPPGYQLDEFPYACTGQGGPSAMARPVPACQNAIQGGFLGAFARWSLKGTPQPFIVVPIPL